MTLYTRVISIIRAIGFILFLFKLFVEVIVFDVYFNSSTLALVLFLIYSVFLNDVFLERQRYYAL